MLETIFVILLIIAIILLILLVEWESMALAGLDVAIWLILALGVIHIEIPYQYSSGTTVHTATQDIESMYPLSILFYGIAIVVALHLIVNMILPQLSQKIKARKML